MPQPHFLIVTYPARGHINPSLHFARRLIRATGVRVTFATGVSAFRHSMISKNDRQLPDGLAFLSFPDTLDGDADGDSGTAVNSSSTDNHLRQIFALKRTGTEALKEFIRSNRDGDSPVTFLVHSLLLTWAAKVAREFHLPSALLWIQPATVFDVYYYNFNGYADVISKRAGHPSDLIEFPKLPPLALRDLPSFVAPSNPYKSAHTAFEEQMECLREETDPKILVNTFDELEPEALTAIPNLKMVAVGPLLPLEIFRRNDNRFPGDSIQVSRDYSYIHWLDSKPESSVIYVSFGTVAVLSKKQLEELARGLIEARRPFLWVITDKPNGEAEEKEIDKISGFRQELDEIGMILSWCSQVELLKHRAIGCFVTHCGWSSTLETLVLGVPVVAFPRWSDQTTNAKLLEDSWRIGVRVRENEEGVVESGEIRRCVEAVMEEKAAELRENAKKWRDLAAAAGREGGSSDKNIEDFVDEILGESCRRLYETDMEKLQDKSVYTTGQDDCVYSFPN